MMDDLMIQLTPHVSHEVITGARNTIYYQEDVVLSVFYVLLDASLDDDVVLIITIDSHSIGKIRISYTKKLGYTLVSKCQSQTNMKSQFSQIKHSLFKSHSDNFRQLQINPDKIERKSKIREKARNLLSLAIIKL